MMWQTNLVKQKRENETNDVGAEKAPVWLESYIIPVCKRCWGQLKNLFTRIRVCDICWYKSKWQKATTLSDALNEANLYKLETIVGKVGGIENFFNIVSSISNDWVLLRREWIKAGSLPWAFWRVRWWIGMKTIQDSEIMTYYKAKICIPWDVFQENIEKFYSMEARPIKYSRWSFSIRGTEKKKLDITIRAYLNYFLRDYGILYRNFERTMEDDALYAKMEEALQANILGEQVDYIFDNEEIKLSKILHILTFCKEKKLPTQGGNFLSRSVKIIYDLPLELLYGDLLYEK